MLTAGKIRSIRAYLGESQAEFGARFAQSRYTVISWEKFGLAHPDFERRILELEGPANDTAETNPAPE